MKLKHILILLFAALLLSSCYGDRDIMVIYTYGNATDKTITISAYMPEKYESDQAINYVLYKQLTIEPGKEVSLELFGFGDVMHPKGSYLTVSNGEKIFTQKYENWHATLYDIRIYTKKVTAWEVYYKYVFTDQDFEDAEPVE